jgi:hypothetical protein
MKVLSLTKLKLWKHADVHLQNKKGYTNLHQIWHAYSTKPEINFCKVITSKKSNMSSTSSEGGSCSLEKHERRMAPWPKFFISKRRLTEQRPQSQKTVLGFSPDEVGFCRSETTQARRTALRPKLFVSATRLQVRRSDHENMSWILLPVKMVSVAWKLCTKKEQCWNHS